MSVCKCDESLGNLGSPKCFSKQGITKGLIMVPRFDSTGVRNFIDTTAPLLLTQGFWDSKINEVDPTKRLYPLTQLYDVTTTRAESKYETKANDAKFFIREGIRDFKATINEVDSIFLGKLLKSRCTQFDVYMIGNEGQVTGNGKVDGKLFGIKVNNQSVNAMYMPSTDTTIQKVELSFEFDDSERDEDLRQISGSDLSAVDVLGFSGLIDVNAKFSSITATSFVMDLSFDYGSAISKEPMVGVTTPNVTIYNVTDSASATVGVAPDLLIKGRYLVTIPSQTSADVLRVTIARNGFDFASVSKVDVVIP